MKLWAKRAGIVAAVVIGGWLGSLLIAAIIEHGGIYASITFLFIAAGCCFASGVRK